LICPAKFLALLSQTSFFPPWFFLPTAMGFFSSLKKNVATVGMDIGAGVASVGGDALNTAAHATAGGFHAVTGNEEQAAQSFAEMHNSAENVGHAVDAVADRSQAWVDLDNSHQPEHWLASWMRHVDDGARLSDLYMIGTHDTVSTTGGDFAQCQAWTVEKQLLSGIRYFDIRVKHVGDELQGHHGIIFMETWLTNQAVDFERFLDANPSEVIVAAVSSKGTSQEGEHCRDFFSEVVHETREREGGNCDRWVLYREGEWPTVGELRGKIYLVVGNGWPACTNVQDEWKVSEAGEKFDKVMAHCRQAPTPGHLSLNFSSCTGVDGVAYHSPKSIAVGVNQRLYDEFKGIWEGHRPDIAPQVIMMDFPGIELVRLFTTKNGPGVFKAALAQESRDEVMETFRKWDRDGNGTISETELAEVLGSLDETFTCKNVQAVLAAADVNHDGVINVEEFINWIYAPA